MPTEIVREYVAPTEYNQWEYRVIFLGPLVEPTGDLHAQTAHKMRSGKYWVQWPDGTEEQVSVEMKKYFTSYSDHGHSHDVEGELPYIVIDHHGSPLSIMVMDANVKIAPPEPFNYHGDHTISLTLRQGFGPR